LRVEQAGPEGRVGDGQNAEGGQRRISRLDELGKASSSANIMSGILELPEVRRRVSPLSVEEYHQLGEYNGHGKRTELIRGIVIEKMFKSPRHSTIVSLLYRLLLAARLPVEFTVRQEQPLTFADSEPEPDISVSRGGERDFADAHPTTAELAIEVAVSSPGLDRENASLYAEAGVKEYWIVLGRERQVEVYRRPENGRYQATLLVGVTEALNVPASRTYASQWPSCSGGGIFRGGGCEAASCRSRERTSRVTPSAAVGGIGLLTFLPETMPARPSSCHPGWPNTTHQT
jgi:Uma2 family endonuclease